jgi:hypothetical protein
MGAVMTIYECMYIYITCWLPWSALLFHETSVAALHQCIWKTKFRNVHIKRSSGEIENERIRKQQLEMLITREKKTVMSQRIANAFWKPFISSIVFLSIYIAQKTGQISPKFGMVNMLNFIETFLLSFSFSVLI